MWSFIQHKRYPKTKVNQAVKNLGTDRISGSNFEISKGFKVVMADPDYRPKWIFS